MDTSPTPGTSSLTPPPSPSLGQISLRRIIRTQRNSWEEKEEGSEIGRKKRKQNIERLRCWRKKETREEENVILSRGKAENYGEEEKGEKTEYLTKEWKEMLNLRH